MQSKPVSVSHSDAAGPSSGRSFPVPLGTAGHPPLMIRLLARLVLVLALLAGPALAAAPPAGPMPPYLRQLDRQYRAGDWVLQCDSWGACHILGAAPLARDPAALRAVVLIRRGDKPGAPYAVRLGLINGLGEILPLAEGPGGAMLARQGGVRPRALPFALGPRGEDGGSHTVTAPDGGVLVRALRRWPAAVLRLGDGRMAAMPRGNLAHLLRIMDRLQHPPADPLTPAERSAWLREYHYRVLRPARAQAGLPDSVSLACDTRTYPVSAEGWQLDRRNRLWIAQCPEGSKLFLQSGEGDPVSFDLRDREGRIQPRIWADYEAKSGLLRVAVPRQGRGDCGQVVRFGWTDAASFGMIEHRKLELCRLVPAEFWPLSWTPSSWRFVPAIPPE